MGLDCYSRLVVGVPYEEVYTKRRNVEKVTRYNEVTGAPYEKSVEKIVNVIGTKEMTEDEWIDFRESLEYEAKEGQLDLLSVSDGDGEILGRVVVSTDSHRSGQEQIIEVTQDEIDEVLADVRNTLQKYGIPPEEVKLFVMSHISC